MPDRPDDFTYPMPPHDPVIRPREAIPASEPYSPPTLHEAQLLSRIASLESEDRLLRQAFADLHAKLRRRFPDMDL